MFLVLSFEGPHTVRQKTGVGHFTGYEGTNGDQRGEEAKVQSKTRLASAGVFEGTTGDSGGGGSQERVAP